MPPTHQIQPVDGEWFFVTRLPISNICAKERWFIKRVLMWMLKDDDKVPQLVGIDPSGFECESDGDYFYAMGSDASHFGPTWKEVYHSSPANKGNVRKIEIRK